MDGKQPKFPGYTALLPPRVRYDKELRPAAKLLYAEISAMTDVTGYCWASNGYLGALLGIAGTTVNQLLAQLKDRGYVDVEVLRDDKGAVSERRIWMLDLGVIHLPPPSKNRGTPSLEFSRDPPSKNNRRSPYKKNDIKKERTPHNPPEGDASKSTRKNVHLTEPGWMPEAFRKLWLWYPTGDDAMHSYRGNKQRAIRAWDKLRPSGELVDTIAEALAKQADSAQWKEGVGIPHLSTYLNGYGWEGWTDGS